MPRNRETLPLQGLVRSARRAERGALGPANLKAETLEDFGVLSSREPKEDLFLAVTRIRMRQMSRERPKQAPNRSRSVKSESDMAPAVKSIEETRLKLKQMLSARPVGAVALEEVAYFCTCALEGEDPELCAEAASNFSQAVGKASQAALRSSSSASACAMFASLLRHPEETCRKRVVDEAQKNLDAAQLLRVIGQGVGGKDTLRRFSASVNLLQVVRLLVSKAEALERLRANDGFRLAVEAWKQGSQVAELAQECCALMLQLAPQNARAAAAAGAGECALTSWQRCVATDVALRTSLVQGFAEVSLLCMPYLQEGPQVLSRLACESLRSLVTCGSAPVILALLKVLTKISQDIKSAPSLFNLGLPELLLAVLGQDNLSSDTVMRRMAAEVLVKTISFAVAGAGRQAPPPALCPAPMGSFRFKEPRLPRATDSWQAELQSRRPPQPTLDPASCASALKRRLETWKFRAVAPFRVNSCEDPEEAALDFDADFESGSLGPVTRLGPAEYEVQLLSDANGGYVQWFCFRVRRMKVGMPYTFHLTNLIKPGSLFEEGCQPVLFSKRRMEECGIAWSREGADVAYYPCSFGSRKLYRVSFDICFPFEEDECFLAYSEPYTFTDLLYDLAPWPWESLAVTMMGNQVPALRLGNQLSTQRVCIVARAHPGETCASWVMRGVMDFLLSDPEAQACLEQLAWLIVPMLNPDGVAAGRTRTNLESVDLNRHHHDDAAAETKGLRAALQAESQRGELLAFIDIHSHSKRRGIFAIANGNDADRLVSLLANRTPLLDLQGTNRTETRPQDVGVGRVAAAAQGYKYSLTIESSLCARHLAIGGEHLLLQDLASVGRAICFAVTDLLYPENEPVEVICAKGDDDLDEDADAAEDEGFRVFTPE